MKTIEDKIKLTADEILAMPEKSPEKLFSGVLEIAKTEYHTLCRRWHPDYNRDANATAVFQHVNNLYQTAQHLIETDGWRGAGVLELPAAASGRGLIARRMRYFKRADFELGEMYIGDMEIAFTVKREYADLFENARRRIASFKFANPAMQKEMHRNLPDNAEYFATAERLIMVLPKAADMILLADLLEHLGGAIDARHVAWIGSSLQNLACYFEYVGIVHHDISPQTVLVSPEHHSVMLLGGWWYANFVGGKINALPNRTINVAPADVLRNKRADIRVDLELIRQIGRELLGEKGSMPIKTNERIPAAMARWFNGATSGSAVADYQLWRNMLEMDFGKPRFCRLDVEPSAIYAA
jgi:hypothetical protein